MFLRPGSTFRIIWQTADPNDATTYYPQAVIKSSLNGTTIATVSLALDSAGRYYYDWLVPNDPTGQGLQIDMTVTVYTDSGHTTLSGNYNKENRIYYIFDLAAALLRTGGGDNTDYQLIEKLVRKEVSKIVIPNYEKHFGSLMDHVSMGHGHMERIEGKVGEISNADVLENLEEHKKLLGELSKAVGFLPSLINSLKSLHQMSSQNLLEGLQNLAEVSGKGSDQTLGAIKKLPAYGKELADIFETLQKTMTALKILNKAFLNVETITVNKARGMEMPEVEEPKPAKKDYMQLAKNLI